MRGFAAFLGMALGACAADAPLSDVPADLKDPWFDVGYVKDGAFVSLDNGVECPIARPLQGGYWTMPTMRVTGMGEKPLVGCELYNDTTDQVLGFSEGERLFAEGDAGEYREHLFLLSLTGVSSVERYEAVDGHAGRLTCWAMNDGMEFAREASVVIHSVHSTQSDQPKPVEAKAPVLFQAGR